MKKLYTYSLSLFFIFLACHFFSQNSAVKSKLFSAGNDIFGTRNFIENKGQFENPVNKSEKVLFKYEHGGEKIYFTSKGLIYEQVKRFPLTEEQREALEQGENFSEKQPKLYYVKMNWVNSNNNLTIEKDEKQSHYFTYGSADLNSYAYKKITYKNVYNNIDIEYSIPSNKDVGIKYSVVLHPGANPNDIKIFYSGDAQKIRKGRNGEIVVTTSLEDIVEHAPQTYYSNGSPVNSAFELKENVLGFVFPDGYQENKTLVIDPWVTSVTTLTTTNSAYDVDYDFAGNTFIFGGSSPCKIAMYNSVGVLQWTFNGTVVTPAWTNAGSASNFGVDKFNGKSYTGQGVVTAGAQVIRLDNLGNYDNFITVANGQYREIWDLGFHCFSGEVFVFGGSTAGNLSAATINLVTATLNISTFQPGSVGCCQDVVSYAIDDQGNIFILYASASSTVTNKICSVNSTFNGNNWTQPTGFSVMNENGNKGAYQPNAGSSNGFNCLAVNSNYVFYYDGLNLAAYSKLTGINSASVIIPGAIVKRQGGIAVDECNNLYLGGNGSILTYSFDGTNFSTLTPIPLGVSTATQNVQDIKLDRSTKTLYVCGTGFVGTYSANLTSTCINFSISVSASNVTVCAGQAATITANGALTYSWSNGSSASSVIVTPTVTTNYTVVGTSSTSCGSASNLAVKTISVVPGPVVSVTGPKIVCKGKTGTLTATGANTYTWNTGATTSTLAITPTVNTTYTVVGTSTALNCNSKAVITVTFSACVGLEDLIYEQQIAKIYPNPVKDKLNIELLDPSGKNIDLSIYNSLGQSIYPAEKLNQGRINTVDLGNLPKGLYIIVLRDESLKQSFRLIKD